MVDAVRSTGASTTPVTCPECGAARQCGRLRRRRQLVRQLLRVGDVERRSPQHDQRPESRDLGVAPMRDDDKRARENEVRTEDLEPYVALRYIARLFKVLAVLLLIMLLGEVVTGIVTSGIGAFMTLLGEATRLLVLAGLLWAGGDITILLIDAGHDLRVARILLGRINAAMHERAEREKGK